MTDTSHTPYPAAVQVSEQAHIKVVLSEKDGGILFEFGEHYQFDTVGSLYHTLRDTLSSYMNDKFIMIKYASRIVCMNYPVLVDPDGLVMYLDPLQTVRDPIMEIMRTKKLHLLAVNSRPYFFRAKTKPHDFPPAANASTKRSIITPAPRHLPTGDRNGD